MNYYAVFLPMKDEDKSREFRQAHLDYLADLQSKGKIYAKGRFPDGAGGLVIYQAESLEEVQGYAANDPYVVLGARGSEVHEWVVSFASE